MEIDYGRLDALEAALGGRAAIVEAFGRGAPMVSRRYYKDFAFDTPGLADGVVIYTPKVDEILVDAWLELDEAWNGTTPIADIGTFVDNGLSGGLLISGRMTGLVAWGANPPTWRLDQPVDTEGNGAGLLLANSTVTLGQSPTLAQATAQLTNGWHVVPSRFVATHPLKLVVSQDGSIGGAASGATQGKARVYVEIAAASPCPG